MPEHELELPEDFADYEYEYEAKGYLAGARILRAGEHAEVVFYDPVRLAQDIEDELAAGNCPTYANIIVVPEITQEAIARAVQSLAESGFAELAFQRPPAA
jgi:hypothetical protein